MNNPMKFLNRSIRKAVSYLILSALLFSLPANSLMIQAETAYDTAEAIHLSTFQDLQEFADHCVSDTWSQGKLFVLDQDIDVSDTDFQPIPSFGGTFLGQGHAIKGLNLKGGSNHIGLFRYIQESGQVYQLAVSGSASAESGHSGLGLLAGCNYGLISGCSSSGNVTGKDQAGGIVGVNEVSGVITDCFSNGIVYGTHLVGGIAGNNKGSIENSSNHCFINTSASDNNLDLSSLHVDAALTDFLTTENAASVTDIGGITGSNSGTIRACTNDGSIGYQHVGYNVGGIAGSQTGYIEGCINYGLLNGRKDVGGIAGQMEPSSELEFYADTLAKLNTEFGKLHQLLTQLDTDASNMSSEMTGQVDRLLTSVEGAQSAVDEMLGNFSSYFDQFSNLTDLTTLPSPRPVSLEFLDDLQDALPTATPTPEPTPEPTAAPTPEPDEGNTDGDTDTKDDGQSPGTDGNDDSQTTDTGSYVSEYLYAPAPKLLPVILREPDNNPDAGSENNGGDEGKNETQDTDPQPTPTPDLKDAIDDIRNNMPSSDDFTLNIDREQIEKDVNRAQDNVYEDASKTLNDFQSMLQNQSAILGSRISASQNALSSSFSAIISDMRILNSMLDDNDQILLQDLQAINDELNVIGNLLTAPESTDPDDILSDVSDEDRVTDITGKVMNCINNGTINGDLNAGGIAGSMSRENNLDPEDDLNLADSDLSLNFRYKERIVVRQCLNNGNVTGKKECAGGIAGEMTLGSIIECSSSGTISSEGAMAGGIAGSSNSNIRSSSAKCTLKGKERVGGIAGYGTNISGCYSMVQIHEGDYYLGSIAGKLADDGEIKDNYFVEGCPAGIDGISYENKAQPLSYEDFLASHDLPEIFNDIYLTFTADGKTISVVTVKYGDSFDPAAMPQVPEKEGCIGSWSDFNQAIITFDQTIEAVYTEYITTLESGQQIEKRPILLLEGTFDPACRLLLSSFKGDHATSTANAEPAETEAWQLQISGTSYGPYTIRYLIPETVKAPQIQCYENGTWKEMPSDTDGSYCIFDTNDPNMIFRCVDMPASSKTGIVIAIITGVLLLGTGIAAILLCKKKKKGKLS